MSNNLTIRTDGICSAKTGNTPRRGDAQRWQLSIGLLFGCSCSVASVSAVSTRHLRWEPVLGLSAHPAVSSFEES